MLSTSASSAAGRRQIYRSSKNCWHSVMWLQAGFVCIVHDHRAASFSVGPIPVEMITVLQKILDSHFGNTLSQERQIHRPPAALCWTGFAIKGVFKRGWKDSSGICLSVFAGSAFEFKQVRKVSIKMQWGGVGRTKKVFLSHRTRHHFLTDPASLPVLCSSESFILERGKKSMSKRKSCQTGSIFSPHISPAGPQHQ